VTIHDPEHAKPRVNTYTPCKEILYDRVIINLESNMNKQELYDLAAQARKERDRTARIEGIVGNVLCTILGACVLFTIALWLTR